jgi:hypothetical protein
LLGVLLKYVESNAEFLDEFQVKPGYTDCQRPLNQIYGDDDAAIRVLGGENSFDAIEVSAADSDLLADVQKRIRFKGNFTGEQNLNVFDFHIRNRNPLSLDSDETRNPVGSEHSHARPVLGGDPNKDVSGKERLVDHLAAVAPKTDFLDCR